MTAAKRPRKKGRTLIQASRAVAPSEKAAYHTISGAGRSQVRREFFGLSASDEDAIVQRIAEFLDQSVKG